MRWCAHDAAQEAITWTCVTELAASASVSETDEAVDDDAEGTTTDDAPDGCGNNGEDEDNGNGADGSGAADDDEIACDDDDGRSVPAHGDVEGDAEDAIATSCVAAKWCAAG